MRFIKVIAISAVLLFTLGVRMEIPEEGMYPLSEIGNIDLVKAGLDIDPAEIYNPDGLSLTDALVNIGGCTGSFVSEEGLIITNHHCAFRSISNASTPENNYLEEGFLADSMEKEIPAKGLTCRITESYEDVSESILDAVEGIADVQERSKIISEKISEIEEQATDEANSIVGDVAEMFIGKTYVLFRYRTIKDVRLVYAPPRSIGEFGGETDNWVWPRHTGDFTFMRAYVAPDGSAAEFSADNVPYEPKKYLKINPSGVDEGDFVFVLGYPARTFRHRPSHYLKYQYKYQLPYIQSLYAGMIEYYTELAEGDEALALKYAPTLKSLANTEKNYRGKLQGIQRLDLIGKKISEETELNNFINSNQDHKEKYGGLFEEFSGVYDSIYSYAELDLWMQRYLRFSDMGRILYSVIEYAEEIEKPEGEREENYKGPEAEKEKNSIIKSYDEIDRIAQPGLTILFLDQLNEIKGGEILLNPEFGSEPDMNAGDLAGLILEFFDEVNRESFVKLLNKSGEEIIAGQNPVLNFAKRLYSKKTDLEGVKEIHNGMLTILYSKLIEIKRIWKNKSFIPDANRTLRLTYGYIRGYSPADAVYYSPVTTLDGVIEKSRKVGDYEVPDRLIELYDETDFGNFYSDKYDGIPVAILYNTDTSGGSSGSPVLNSRGELVGINFDRAFEATINDFAWDESYSRSIGVDIRYVLWVTQKIGNANALLRELGI